MSKITTTDSMILRTVAKYNGNLVEASKELGTPVKMIKSTIERNASAYAFDIQEANKEHRNAIDSILKKVWEVIPKKLEEASPKELAFILKALMDAQKQVSPLPIKITETSSETTFGILTEEELEAIEAVSDVPQDNIIEFQRSLTKGSQSMPKKYQED